MAKMLIKMTSFRGIVVIPELDTPGNLGAGWQAVDADYTLCVERYGIAYVCLVGSIFFYLSSFSPQGPLGPLVHCAPLWPA